MKKKINNSLRELYWVGIVLMPYITYILAIVGIISLLSCEKEKPKPTYTPPPSCDCYEIHQVFLPGMGWANDYNTDTTEMNCNLDNGVWTYTNAEHTKRKRVNCL